jgi:hypothetical protein
MVGVSETRDYKLSFGYKVWGCFAEKNRPNEHLKVAVGFQELLL